MTIPTKQLQTELLELVGLTVRVVTKGSSGSWVGSLLEVGADYVKISGEAKLKPSDKGKKNAPKENIIAYLKMDCIEQVFVKPSDQKVKLALVEEGRPEAG